MLRDELRAHTSAHHERIERALDIPRSVRSSGAYVQLLKRFYGFYRPYESQLLVHAEQLDKAGVSLSTRLKVQDLRDDLISLGVREEAIEFLPQCEKLPNLPTWRHALGAMYVTEGSTLGNQVITRTLRDCVTRDTDIQMTFFKGYGAKTGTMWRSFVHVLNSIEPEADEREAVLTTAAQTFVSLTAWMTWQTEV